MILWSNPMGVFLRAGILPNRATKVNAETPRMEIATVLRSPMMTEIVTGLGSDLHLCQSSSMPD